MAEAVIGAAAATAQRVLVGGVIVFVDSSTFMKILSRLRDKDIMIVHGITGVFSKIHVYLVTYQGVVFIVKSKDPLPITPDIEAKELRLPPM